MPSIQDFIINVKNYGIPEFQRRWGWTEIKILNFYDSVLHGYPLPRFFMWRVGVSSPVGLSSFRDSFEKKLSKEYSPLIIKRDDLSHNTTAVCDGQQRLTSFLIGFKGYNWGTSKQPKYLYLNLLHYYLSPEEINDLADLSSTENLSSDSEDEDKKKPTQFKFLSDNEVKEKDSENSKHNSVKSLWVKVADFYEYSINSNVALKIKWKSFLSQNKLDENLNAHTLEHAIDVLGQFEGRIGNQTYLDFQDISISVNGNLENAVEFFIRINDGGKKLDPNELLFALLTRYLQDNSDVDLKKDFNSIITNHSNVVCKAIKYNFLLRICLYTSTDQILFKADSFNENNCNKIISNWPTTFIAINKVFELISELGLAKCINSNNSIIPIIHHYFKRLQERDSYIPTIDEKNEILNYFIRSIYSPFWGGEHGDAKLKRLWLNQEVNYTNVNYNFKYTELINILPPHTSFEVEEYQIDELLNSSYKSANTRAILYLLYNGLNHSYKYEIDHIHPQSKCELSASSLENFDYNFSQDEIEFIKNTYQLLPNLQLIRDTCNREKSNREINDWINAKLAKEEYDCLNNQRTKIEYLNTNFITIQPELDAAEYMKFNNYRVFYENRRLLLKDRIKAALS